jgi:hypothetical protein
VKREARCQEGRTDRVKAEEWCGNNRVLPDVMLIGMKVAEEKVEKVKKVAAQPERAARLEL